MVLDESVLGFFVESCNFIIDRYVVLQSAERKQPVGK